MARDTTTCSEEPTHPGERVGREQHSDLSLRRGLGLEECIPAVFTAIAFALTDSQQNEESSSAGASAGGSNFCSQQILLPAISALSSGAGGSCGISSRSGNTVRIHCKHAMFALAGCLTLL